MTASIFLDAASSKECSNLLYVFVYFQVSRKTREYIMYVLIFTFFQGTLEYIMYVRILLILIRNARLYYVCPAYFDF